MKSTVVKKLVWIRGDVATAATGVPTIWTVVIAGIAIKHFALNSGRSAER